HSTNFSRTRKLMGGRYFLRLFWPEQSQNSCESCLFTSFRTFTRLKGHSQLQSHFWCLCILRRSSFLVARFSPAARSVILGWDSCLSRGISILPMWRGRRRQRKRRRMRNGRPDEKIAAAFDFLDCSCRRIGADDHSAPAAVLCRIFRRHAQS